MFEQMYFSRIITDDNESSIKTLFREEYKFEMTDKLKKINYKRNQNEMNKPMFSIHSTKLERTLFNEDWNGRTIYNFPYTVPNFSGY